MNGQLSEHPLAELLKEVSEKGFSGALRVERERLKCVFYFENGKLVYAASNARNLRLREYLLVEGITSAEYLSKFGERLPELELGDLICEEGLLSRDQMEKLQSQQTADVVRLAVPWSDGTWEFDSRARLTKHINLQVDLAIVLLESSRSIPVEFAASRFRNPAEVISPTSLPDGLSGLQPEEGFLLYRVEQPTPLPEVVALSGQTERNALRIIYSLALANLLQRERWHNAFRSDAPQSSPRKEQARPAEIVTEATAENKTSTTEDLESFLSRIATATSHYAVLKVANSAAQSEIKGAYYELARRFHPDHYRQESDTSLKARIDSAFARVTQAYDVLSEVALRTNYDSKLDNQARADDFAKSAPKATEQEHSSDEPEVKSEYTADAKVASNGVEAEEQFKQGFAAYQLGQLNIALGLLSAAARSKPDESRYRAYYGQALSKGSNSKRLAESELQAALKLEPTNSDYRVMLAELYVELGFPVRAKGEVDRALAKDPNHQKARELRGRLTK